MDTAALRNVMQWSQVAVVVPARLASTRLPEKLLATVHGRPVLAWTLDALRRSTIPSDRIFLATANAALAEVADGCGVTVLPTPPDASSGSHRVALASAHFPETVQWVINVQGDEPLFNPTTLDRLLEACTPDRELVTAVCDLTLAEWRAPSTVKALIDRNGQARWFSRTPIPLRLQSAGDGELRRFLVHERGIQRHLGVYAFRRDRLRAWPDLPRTAMAAAAGLEQLDALLAGWSIHAIRVDRPRGPSVDTAADLAEVRRILSNLPHT